MLIQERFIISPNEKQRLDRLFGSALIDKALCHRLVSERDNSLLAEYGISAETQNWLRYVPASSLADLARAVSSQSPAAF
jgi:hypothetical protein